MKNKFTRFLCFFLCFALCFAWLGPPQQVHATGIVPLLGVVIMFMIGSGIGFSMSGASQAFSDGIMGYVEEFVNHGHENFWEAIERGTTIAAGRGLLLNKVATDALNGFVNWLQTDKGWTEGSVIEDSVSVQTFSGVRRYYQGEYVSDTMNLTQVVSTGTTDLYDADGPIYLYSLDELLYDEASNSGLQILCKYFWYYFKSLGSFSEDTAIFYQAVGSQQSVFRYGSKISSFGYSPEDIIGFTFSYDYVSKTPYLYFYAVTDTNRLIRLGSFLLSSTSYISNVNYSHTISIDSLNLPDTSDWDSSTNLGLFTGHSGAIPQSVDEYNAFVLNDLNSGVVPEVSTDVIGLPDVRPDEGDGTLAGTVSGILAQLMALPQNIANLILDGVKSIFIPDPEHLEGEFLGLLEELNDVYSFDFDLDSLFSAGKEPEDIYGYYPVAGKSLSVLFVSWHYLKKGVEYFRPYIRGFIVLMLIFYNLRQFMAIFGLGGVMNGDSGDNRRNDLAA